MGAEHPNTATSLNSLAALYRAQGNYAAAEPLLQRALSIYEKALGAEHPSIKARRDDSILVQSLIFERTKLDEPQLPPGRAPAIPLPKHLHPKNGNGGNSQKVAGNSKSERHDGVPEDWKGGRNDICWCGSGLKYKKCHGK